MTGDREELLALYALGALEPSDAADIDALLAEDPAARAEARRMAAIVAELPYAARPVAPSPGVKAALLARVAVAVDKTPDSRRASAKPGARLRVWPRLLTGALAAAAAITLAVLGADRQRLVGELDRLVVENAALRESLSADRALLASLADPDMVAVEVAGTEAEPGAQARFFADRRTGRSVLVARDLPPLAAGTVYQLWLIRGDVPVSAGTFTASDDGTARFEPARGVPLATFEAVGVSIEPDGGSPAPTGDIVLFGTRS